MIHLNFLLLSWRKLSLGALLLLIGQGLLFAQVEMSITGDLTLKPGDADATSYYRQTDSDDNVCALIKVKPSNPMGATLVLQTGGGIAPVPPPKGVSNKQSDGSWWYWLSPKTRNIFFTAEGYTETAPLGVRLEPGKVYELKLTVGAAAQVIHKYKLERYVMKLDITPKSCVVSYGKDASYNMDRVVIDDGYFEAVLDQGIYYYKIETEYYETYTGTYRLDAASKEESITMKPAFGYLRVTSDPSGAEVYLDGSLQSAGKTPFTSGMLTRGTHSVLLRVDDYYSSESRYDVLPDGTVQDVPVVRLKPQFGTVTCLCEDAQAELTVSDASGKVMGRGKSGMTLRLNSRGSYKLESARSGHASQSIGIQGGTALEGLTVSVTVGAPVPLYGGLQISSDPRRAEVYIDGVLAGRTTYVGEVLVGEHQVELRMEGYPSAKFSVKVEKDQETLVNRKLEKNVAHSLAGGASGVAGSSGLAGASASSGSSSASRTANCYIVSKSGTYSFPTVKGNSTQPVGNVSRAEVLWESFGTSIAPSTGDIIQSVSYAAGSGSSAGTITFSTPSTLKNGNAVIAAKDASGKILWSWHIWVCKDYDPVATAQTYYNNAGVMMDRNLGATSATPGDVGALGLLYQWGRKDPFLGSSSISSNTKAASTLSWPSLESSDSSTGTIAYAVAHPTTFITSNTNNYDWYYTGSSSTDNNRWKSAKTIYDPCPPGWKVPEGSDNGVWSKAANTSGSFSYAWNSTNKGMNFSRKFGSASNIWYPAAGYLYDVDGRLYDVGRSGDWWSCTPNDGYAYGLLFYRNGNVYPSDNGSRAYGLSVRCLQE